MGAAIPLILILVLVAVVAVVAVLAATRSLAAKQQEVTQSVQDDTSSSLDYEVRAGQDPAVVIAALEREGYTAVADQKDPRVVHVACPAGADRERAHVRAIIGGVHTSAIDAGVPMDPEDVRFRDEH